ncbi:RNA polymerase II C-terminal domain phosphatase-like 1 [Acorus gramineus]|uniref:RNA polymerase II C-terminal domain phosphatase-like 1 n=1 Tax=Acorus gramineus TaxID=55184 RepID=A0AAV9B4X1_ACOGR|nr:RNA polymerase II C-terminal domain phosphatase-like 1 [Acorus gramineus]
MTGAEVERRLHNADEKRGTDSDPPLGMAHSDVNHEAFQQPSSSDVTGVPICRETVQNLRVPGVSAGGKVTQSETGLDTRLSKMEDQNSLNLSQSKTSAQRSIMVTQPCGGWLVEDINPDQFTNQGSRINQEFEPLGPEKHQVQNGNSKNSIDSSGLVSIPQVEEAHCGDQRPALLVQSSPPFLGVLLEIGKKCDYKVEFRSIVSTSKDLQSVEVLFTGEKIGIGTGKTLKEANLQAAENALHNLASKYAAFIAPNAQTIGGKLRKFPLRNENGILSDTPIGSDKLSSREPMPDVSRSGLLISPEDSERLSFLVSNIRELCMTEGLRVAFQDQPPASVILNKGEFYHQVEIDGQILGKGIGLNKDKAKLQAAEEALQSLKSTVNQQTQKPPNPQRSQAFPNKRLKVDNSRGLHGTSSSRYHKNGQPTS